MSIYDKQLSQLVTSDLEELLAGNAVENLRLEFKSLMPSKDEMLKKLSSFANTFGGYLIVGAGEDGNGRVQNMNGIEPVPGFKQTVVQWCQAGTYPPVQAFVSEPIAAPSDATKVCYVIYVYESLETPHFINDRKGAYVRTAEYSHPFYPRLATADELMQLQGRRAEAVSRKLRLLTRAEERYRVFAAHVVATSTVPIDRTAATLKLFAIPRFPARALVSLDDLMAWMETHRLTWRSSEFPATRDVTSQLESALIANPGGRFSLLEASIWGHCFVVEQIELVTEYGPTGIHLNSFMGHLLLFLDYYRQLILRLGFDGVIELQVRLERVRGKPWLYFPHNFPETGPSSPFDDDIGFTIEVLTDRLTGALDNVASELVKVILFALNWPGAGRSAESIQRFVEYGYRYSNWEIPAARATGNVDAADL
jgi:hypothetical protein